MKPASRRRELRATGPIGIALCLFLTLLASCKSVKHADYIFPEDDIRVAVFLYQFDLWQGHKFPAYYLNLSEQGADPTDRFLERFTGNNPPVRKFSACSTARMRVADKQTGELGILFTVSSIKWISDTEVEVKGGHYENGMSASGNTYTVRKIGNKWFVVKRKTDWVS